MRKKVLLSILAAGFLLPSFAHAELEFEFELYMMATSIEGEAGVGRVSGVPVDVDMDKILENLDLAGMFHWEMHHDSGWGVALDYGFMNLEAKTSVALGGVVTANVHQGVFEALLLNRNHTSDGHIDLFAGIRWWDNELGARIDPIFMPDGVELIKVAESWFDLVVGMRWEKKLSDKFNLQLRGDVGGFGLESDFTSTLEAGIHYAMGDHWVVDLKYKGSWVDYDNEKGANEGYFAYDTLTHGPILGFIYKF